MFFGDGNFKLGFTTLEGKDKEDIAIGVDHPVVQFSPLHQCLTRLAPRLGPSGHCLPRLLDPETAMGPVDRAANDWRRRHGKLQQDGACMAAL